MDSTHPQHALAHLSQYNQGAPHEGGTAVAPPTHPHMSCTLPTAACSHTFRMACWQQIQMYLPRSILKVGILRLLDVCQELIPACILADIIPAYLTP